jgi:hypothetical protein
MAALDFESDAFLTLLAEALRAGPGSPAWHEALERIRTRGPGVEQDEYSLLLAAREHLESGREYRQVRPGPAFGHKVLTAIEEQAARPAGRRLPVASLIAGLSAIAIVAMVIGIGYAILRGGLRAKPVQDLERTYFTEEVVQVELDHPPDRAWRIFGSLPLVFAQDHPRGMRPGPLPGAADYRGGGIVWTQPVAAAEPVEMEVAFRLPHGEANSDIIAQLFISDELDLGGERATTPHELVVLLRGRGTSVILPSGRVAGQLSRLPDEQRELVVRIMINRTEAIVAAGEQRPFSGAHELDPARPWHLGVRLLSRDPQASQSPAIYSIRVRTPRD